MIHLRLRRKTFKSLSSFLTLLSLLIFSSGVSAQTPELTIYTYDSFVAHGGLGEAIFPEFEKKCGCKIHALPSGDGAQLLTRMELDSKRGKPGAQIVLGFDQNIWSRLEPLVEKMWKPQGYENLLPEVKTDFVPFDYGVLAFIVDQNEMKTLGLKSPTSIRDLLRPEWKKNFILEDPRTSTPGLSFLLATREIFKPEAPPMGYSDFESFWEKLHTQWLTLASGWDQAYGLFLKKEAPAVWSYTTSEAYHVEHGDTSYRAVLFGEGQPIQIEGAALIKGAFHDDQGRKLAREFLEFMISPEVQNKIAKKNWMYPVLKNIALPESFKNLPQPKKVIKVFPTQSELKTAIDTWSRAIQ